MKQRIKLSEECEKEYEQLRMSMVALTNQITEFNNKYGLNLYPEFIDYMQETSEVDER